MKRVRASIAVECAVLLPLVILILALFITALKTTIGYMVVKRAVMETAETISDYSYLYELLDLSEFSKEATDSEETSDLAYRLLLDGFFTALAKGILSEKLSNINLQVYGIEDGLNGISLWGTKSFYENGTHKALVKIKVSYRPVLIDEGSFVKLQKVEIQSVCAAFLGDNPFSQSETKVQKVYQIGEGEKYHILDCYLIDKTVTELKLWEATKTGYEPCSYCDPWEADTVYVSNGGLKYHTNQCPHLFPNLTEMTLEEAEEKGLGPCGLCFSEEEYFVH